MFSCKFLAKPQICLQVVFLYETSCLQFGNFFGNVSFSQYALNFSLTKAFILILSNISYTLNIHKQEIILSWSPRRFFLLLLSKWHILLKAVVWLLQPIACNLWFGHSTHQALITPYSSHFYSYQVFFITILSHAI